MRGGFSRGAARIIYLAAFVVLVLIAVFAGYRLFFYRHIVNGDVKTSRVIAFGDSLTSGFGAPSGQSYPDQLAHLCHCEIVNRGVPGDTTAMALKRLDHDVLSNDPRLVVIGLGGNDLLHSVNPETARKNLEEMVSKIQDRGGLVVLLGIRGMPLDDRYSSIYRKIAREKGCVLVPDILSGILSNPRMKSDQVHPNAEGYKIMAARVYDAIRKYIR